MATTYSPIQDPTSIIEMLKRRSELTAYYTQLTSMGYSASYINSLKSRGVEALPEIGGLLKATSAQVTEINRLWGLIS